MTKTYMDVGKPYLEIFQVASDPGDQFIVCGLEPLKPVSGKNLESLGPGVRSVCSECFVAVAPKVQSG